MTLRLSTLVCLLPVALAMAGCHCCGVSERYGDKIDSIADHESQLERFYRPGLDMTRICRDCKGVNPYPAVYPDSRWLLNASNADAPPPTQNMPPAGEPTPIPPVPGASELPVLDTTSFKPIERSQAAKVAPVPNGPVSPVPQPKPQERHPQASLSADANRIQLTKSEKIASVPPFAVAQIPNIDDLRLVIPVSTETAATEIEQAPALQKPISAPAGVPPSPYFFMRYQQ